MPKKKTLPGESPLMLNPREAAALDRLLDVYVRTEQDDPGLEDLKSVRQKLLLCSQNHVAYATWRPGA